MVETALRLVRLAGALNQANPLQGTQILDGLIIGTVIDDNHFVWTACELANTPQAKAGEIVGFIIDYANGRLVAC
jgi:hypothetical protein